MLDKFIFENHLGQRFNGLENRVYLDANTLRDYEWSYDTINSRISRFYRKITKRKIPLVVFCKTEEDAVTVKNRLLELAEVDIEAKLPGKIWVNDYYTLGWITASTKAKYLTDKRFCVVDLTFTSNDPVWHHEQTHVYTPGQDSSASMGGGADFPYDYRYDFALSMTGQTLFCDSVGANAFRLRIYGEITNPTVNIGGHAYSVKGSIGAGESLLIDSLEKTITLTKASGSKINWFDKRNRESYIFEPIPAGQNVVTWSGEFGFDLTVIEKRSEPKWI